MNINHYVEAQSKSRTSAHRRTVLLHAIKRKKKNFTENILNRMTTLIKSDYLSGLDFTNESDFNFTKYMFECLLNMILFFSFVCYR